MNARRFSTDVKMSFTVAIIGPPQCRQSTLFNAGWQEAGARRRYAGGYPRRGVRATRSWSTSSSASSIRPVSRIVNQTAAGGMWAQTEAASTRRDLSLFVVDAKAA